MVCLVDMPAKELPFCIFWMGKRLRISFFLSRAAQIAYVMLQLNLKRGDWVTAQIENHPRHWP